MDIMVAMMKATTTNPAVLEFLRQMRSNGGKKRAKNLTSKRRRQIARKAARTRWGKKR
jgi:hypothetical protein